MDDKTKSTMVGSIIIGGLMGAGIAIVTAIFSNQAVGSSIGTIIGFAIGGAVSMSLLNLRKRK
jgi:hypothetical protein